MKVNEICKIQIDFLFEKSAIRHIVNICLILLLVECINEQYVEKLFPCNSTLKDSYGVTSHVTRKGWDWEINASEIKLIGNSGIKKVRADFDYRILQ